MTAAPTRVSRGTRSALVAVALALSWSGPAGATGADGSCWALRGLAAGVETDNALALDLDRERRQFGLGHGSGLGVR